MKSIGARKWKNTVLAAKIYAQGLTVELIMNYCVQVKLK